MVIAAGYNYPYWDPARFDRSIDSMINTLTAAGVEHVYWVTLREVDPQYISGSAWRQIQPYYWYFPTVNAHLEAALERHPDLTLIDWAAAANRPGLTYDAIHLNTTGATLYSDLIRQGVEAASTRVANGSTTRVNVPGAAGATAAAVNLTTTDPRTAGFLTLHRCDRPVPLVSMHNYGRAEVVAHSGIVPLDANGDFCVTAKSATNLIVDVTGLFPADEGFQAVAPTRWFDSRPGGRTDTGPGRCHGRTRHRPGSFPCRPHGRPGGGRDRRHRHRGRRRRLAADRHLWHRRLDLQRQLRGTGRGTQPRRSSPPTPTARSV